MIGLSERDRMLLRSFLAASQARTGVRWDGGAGQPAVYFIDLDTPPGAEFWQSLPDSDRRDAAIVVSAAPPAGARCLARPLRSATLLAVLDQMPLTTRALAPAAVAPPASAARPLTPAPKPGEPMTLLDLLDGAAGTTARTVQSAHWPDLVLGNGNTHAMRTAELDHYAEGFAASLEVSHAGKYTGGPMDDALRVEIDTLRWLALLYAPIGEIASRLPRPKRARLRRPPEFGHLPHKLHHVRMAAVLGQRAATPQELADAGGTDQETVHRFLGACAAVGLLEEIVDAPVAPPLPAPVPARLAEPPIPRPLAAPAKASPTPAPAIVAATQAADAMVAPTVAVTATEPAIGSESAPPTADADAAEAAGTTEASAAPAAPEAVSVLERLRASREQNRARVAAAIRSISK